jgi:hypothetical protein
VSNTKLIHLGKELANKLSDVFSKLSDQEAVEILGSGDLDHLLKLILSTKESKKNTNLQASFPASKWRGTAFLRHAIHSNHGIKGAIEEGSNGYVSPSYIQWFDDGMIILRREKEPDGFLGRYPNTKELSYAILTRDAKAGDEIGPEYFEFVDPDKFQESLSLFPKKQLSNLREPIGELESLLSSQNNDELKYQELLLQYPWVLGFTYKLVQRHTRLDDQNIPDFTGIRVHDEGRDIIEIKAPFTKMFRENGDFGNEFNAAWNQAERYLDFARQDKDYLARKNVKFDNPKCILILGYNLTVTDLARVRTKERLNPAISLRTYNDLLVSMKATVSFIESMKDMETKK